MARQKPFDLAFPAEYYTPYGIKNLTDRQLREEFTRMRDVAQKRVKRLIASEFKNTEVAKQYGKGFAEFRTLAVKTPKQAGTEERAIAQAMTRRNIEAEFMKMAVYLRSPELQLAGLRARRAENIKKFRAHGYLVNNKNYFKFLEFMERMREKYGSKIFDSDQAADLFSAAERAKLTPEQLDKMVERYQTGGIEGAEEMHKISQLKNPRKIREAYAAAFETAHGE